MVMWTIENNMITCEFCCVCHPCLCPYLDLYLVPYHGPFPSPYLCPYLGLDLYLYPCLCDDVPDLVTLTYPCSYMFPCCKFILKESNF